MANGRGLAENPRILYEDAAIAKVEALLRAEGLDPLTATQKRIVFLEGYSPDVYPDSKGILTTGVGQTGVYLDKTFLESFKAKEAETRAKIPDYDTLPEYVQQEIMSGFYRGDLSGSPKTLELINKGLWQDAAKEFLDHDEYRAEDTSPHIKERMEAISNAFLRYAKDQAFTSTNLQKGGTTVAHEQIPEETNAQMEQIGLIQEPRDVDPVSGNEIPLGSTAEGVRDDEVAAVSPGEFVIPEYAVNFHGLKFYMQSLAVAKEGLEQMDQMGMTGKPDEATISDDTALPTMNNTNGPQYNGTEDTYAKGGPIFSEPIPTAMFQSGGLVPPTVPPLTVPAMQTIQVPLVPPVAPQVAPPVAPQVAPPVAPPVAQVPVTRDPYAQPIRPVTTPPPQVTAGQPTPTYPEQVGHPIVCFRKVTGSNKGHTYCQPQVGPFPPQPREGYEPVSDDAPPLTTTPTTPEVPPSDILTPEEEEAAQREEDKEAAEEDALEAAAELAHRTARIRAVNETLDLEDENVPDEFGMTIDGVWTTDAMTLEPYMNAKHNAVITSPSGALRTIWNAAKIFAGSSPTKLVLDIFRSAVGELKEELEETGETQPISINTNPDVAGGALNPTTIQWARPDHLPVPFAAPVIPERDADGGESEGTDGEQQQQGTASEQQQLKISKAEEARVDALARADAARDYAEGEGPVFAAEKARVAALEQADLDRKWDEEEQERAVTAAVDAERAASLGSPLRGPSAEGPPQVILGASRSDAREVAREVARVEARTERRKRELESLEKGGLVKKPTRSSRKRKNGKGLAKRK